MLPRCTCIDQRYHRQVVPPTGNHLGKHQSAETNGHLFFQTNRQCTVALPKNQRQNLTDEIMKRFFSVLNERNRHL